MRRPKLPRLKQAEDETRQRWKAAWARLAEDHDSLLPDSALDLVDELSYEPDDDPRTQAAETALEAYAEVRESDGSGPWPNFTAPEWMEWWETAGEMMPEEGDEEDMSMWPHLLPEPPPVLGVESIRRDFDAAKPGTPLHLAFAYVLSSAAWAEAFRAARARQGVEVVG